ncbi:30S ribosomal protein S20 [Patescibacteria group bacterium]|nr:30S ribosomal protein S20 [Patescibacteria group bacterium]
MPVIQSAIKKLKQARSHEAQNRGVKKQVKELIDAFKKNPTVAAYSKAVSALDKAAKNNVIHKNKAARLKSRLSKRLPKTETKAKGEAKPKAAKTKTAKK